MAARGVICGGGTMAFCAPAEGRFCGGLPQRGFAVRCFRDATGRCCEFASSAAARVGCGQLRTDMKGHA